MDTVCPVASYLRGSRELREPGTTTCTQHTAASLDALSDQSAELVSKPKAGEQPAVSSGSDHLRHNTSPPGPGSQESLKDGLRYLNELTAWRLKQLNDRPATLITPPSKNVCGPEADTPGDGNGLYLPPSPSQPNLNLYRTLYESERRHHQQTKLSRDRVTARLKQSDEDFLQLAMLFERMAAKWETTLVENQRLRSVTASTTAPGVDKAKGDGYHVTFNEKCAKPVRGDKKDARMAKIGEQDKRSVKIEEERSKGCTLA